MSRITSLDLAFGQDRDQSRSKQSLTNKSIQSAIKQIDQLESDSDASSLSSSDDEIIDEDTIRKTRQDIRQDHIETAAIRDSVASILMREDEIKRLQKAQKESNDALETYLTSITQDIFQAEIKYLADKLSRPVESIIIDWNEEYATNGIMIQVDDKLIVSPKFIRSIVIECNSINTDDRNSQRESLGLPKQKNLFVKIAGGEIKRKKIAPRIISNFCSAWFSLRHAETSEHDKRESSDTDQQTKVYKALEGLAEHCMENLDEIQIIMRQLDE